MFSNSDRFRLQKCEVFISLTLKKKEKRFLVFGNQDLKHVFERKDLAVIVDADLQFYEYITTKIKKSNVMTGFRHRCKKQNKDIKILVKGKN